MPQDTGAGVARTWPVTWERRKRTRAGHGPHAECKETGADRTRAVPFLPLMGETAEDASVSSHSIMCDASGTRPRPFPHSSVVVVSGGAIAIIICADAVRLSAFSEVLVVAPQYRGFEERLLPMIRTPQTQNKIDPFPGILFVNFSDGSRTTCELEGIVGPLGIFVQTRKPAG
eukprot:gene13497-biopygen497